MHGSRAYGDLLTPLWRESLSPHRSPLLPTKPTQCDGGGVFARISVRDFLVDLTGSKIDNELRKLVCVSRALA